MRSIIKLGATDFKPRPDACERDCESQVRFFQNSGLWWICFDIFEQGFSGRAMPFMADLTTIIHHLQRQLIPALVEELGVLSVLDQPFCEVISLTDPGRFTRRYEWCGNGAPPCPRPGLAHAFIAEHVYPFPTTSALIDALKSRRLWRPLCGWERAGEIPSEPTFSRAFDQWAQDPWPQQIHEPMVKTHAGPKRVGPVSGTPPPSRSPNDRPPSPRLLPPCHPANAGVLVFARHEESRVHLCARSHPLPNLALPAITRAHNLIITLCE
jgi:hypothetical protein